MIMTRAIAAALLALALGRCTLRSDVTISPLFILPTQERTSSNSVRVLVDKGDFAKAARMAGEIASTPDVSHKQLTAIGEAELACGRFDGMLSARSCRSVDAAAAQLIVREAGCEIVFIGYELDAAALDLETRYPVVAARSPDHLDVVLAAQEAGAAGRSG